MSRSRSPNDSRSFKHRHQKSHRRSESPRNRRSDRKRDLDNRRDRRDDGDSSNRRDRRDDRDDRDSSNRRDRRRSPSPKDGSSKRSRWSRSPKPAAAKLKEETLRDYKPSSSSKQDSKKVEEETSKPSFEVSGKLAGDTNTFKGVVIKYNEPSDAAKPRLRWRLYPMKGEDVLQPLYIHRQSAYLVGRDRKIADFPVDHPSCSKQHAVFQYRSIPFEREGHLGRRTVLYIIDLGSSNGTYLNGERIEAQRYYELKEQDIVKFGYSQREYAVLHELSAEGTGGEELDVDMEEEEDIDREGAEERIKKEEEDYF